jgi:predicted MFS family arabinose efflux permease
VSPAGSTPAVAGLGLKVSILSWRFLRIALTAILLTSATLGMIVNYVPIATSLGFPRSWAVASTSIIGIASIAGRLITGTLLDRLSGPLIGAVSCTLPIAAALILLGSEGHWIWGVAAAVMLGLCLGAELDVLAYVTVRYFGLANYAAIFGLVTGLIALGQGMGPTIGSMVYDRTGSYEAFLWGVMPVAFFAARCVASLGPYPDENTFKS